MSMKNPACWTSANYSLRMREHLLLIRLTSAVAAMEHLNTERYDVIISDYQVPEMDWIGLLTK